MSDRSDEPTWTHLDENAGPSHRPLRLLVVLGEAMVSHPLPRQGYVVVGRTGESMIPVNDPSISRRHFMLHIGVDTTVTDLGSKNGILVRGQRLTRDQTVALAPGDALRAGRVLFLLQEKHSGEPHAPTPTSRTEGDDPSALVPGRALVPLWELAQRVARAPISVILTGETGVGKELFAEAIHRMSPRASRPFMRLNCAALPEALLESELFGYERGAFTGAGQRKLGLLETAEGGTVFLDELGEMALSVQAKLLQVLEDKQLRRVGGIKPSPLDVRFLSATNRDLEQAVQAGTFRRDLLFRLNGICLTIPPLRQRIDEIEGLATTFIGARFAAFGLAAPPRLSPVALAALCAHPWPGNVRELKNVVDRALLLTRDGIIHVPDLGLGAPTSPPEISAGSGSSEADEVIQALGRYAGNQSPGRPLARDRAQHADRAHEAPQHPAPTQGLSSCRSQTSTKDTEGARLEPSLEPSPRWPPGTRLGDRYMVRRQLGRGGMGEVYVAWDVILTKEVVLKRLHRTDDAALPKLRREVVIAQKVTHENVCRTYDLEIIDGDAVVKMEYVAGRTLAERLAQDPRLSVEEALRITRQLATGLVAVHAAGVVHRDLKPSNVILADQGPARLMDFGIASADPHGADVAIAGTPSYMAPEQIHGSEVDGRADFYALGCVLYRMLTGQSPFATAVTGDVTATVASAGASPLASPPVEGGESSWRRLTLWAQQLTQPVADVRKLRAEVPPWLARLTAQLLSRDAAARPRDAEALLARLDGPGRPWRRRAPLMAVALVALVVVGLYGRAHEVEEWRPVTRQLDSFDDAYGALVHFAPDGKSLVFGARRDGIRRVWSAPLSRGVTRPISPPGFKNGYYMRDGQRLLVFGERGGIAIFRPGDIDVHWCRARPLTPTTAAPVA